ncbi:hypothetical protein SARC_16405, partial [Sphaeroforma arctica JP610]
MNAYWDDIDIAYFLQPGLPPCNVIVRVPSACWRIIHTNTCQRTRVEDRDKDVSSMETPRAGPLQPTYERLPAYECQRRVKYGDTKNQALSDLFKGIANYYETMKAYLQPIEWIKEAPYRHAAASLYACPFEISLD